MYKPKLSFFLFFLFVILINSIYLVNAVPPVTQLNTIGNLEIAYPKYTYLKQYSSFNLNIHVENGSNYETNGTTSCFLELYNATGDETLDEFMLFNGIQGNQGDFYVNINGRNFSDLGIHYFIINCNNTIMQTGFVSGVFEVTSTGLSNILLIIILITSLAFGFLITSTFGNTEFFLFISGCLFLVLGIFIMIYGLNDINNMFTRSISFISLGLGLLLTLGSYLDSNEEENYDYYNE